MPVRERHKTSHPGVYYTIGKRLGGKGEEKIYYVIFKKDGKTYEEQAGRQYTNGMNARQAADFLRDRLSGNTGMHLTPPFSNANVPRYGRRLPEDPNGI